MKKSNPIYFLLRRKFVKILLMTKILSLFVFVSIVQASSLSYSQTARIDLDKQNVSLKDVIWEIQEQTDFEFFYSSSDIEGVDNLNIEMENVLVEDVLKQCLVGTDLTYEIKHKAIILKKAHETKQVPQKEKTLKGRVTDDGDGLSMVGVTVYFKGTAKGTVTDINGDYSLDVPEGVTSVVFSFVGYKTVEFTIGGQEVIDVQLKVEKTDISEVVVTGMQSRAKQHSIGSVSQISHVEMESVGSTTIDKALSGRMSGVYVRNVSGRPGETGQIQIRGINTLTGDTDPLYVLDGMPLQSGEVSGGVNSLITNGIGNIPPEDIESITILKDAIAASIYGSRAANGVVVITTKVGQAGKDYINYTGNFGVTMPPKSKHKFMDSRQKLAFERELYNKFYPESGGRMIQILNKRDNGILTAQEAESQLSLLEGINTDWLDVLYDLAFTQSHNITLSGGTNKTQYYASASYKDSEGTLMNNKFQQGGFNMKLSRFVTNNFLVRLNLYSTLKKNIEGQAGTDPFKYGVFANPYEIPYNDDGSYAYDNTYINNNRLINSDPQNISYLGFNILRELNENTLTNMYGNIRAQLSFELDFLKDFKWIGTGVADYTSVHNLDESQPGTYRSWVNNWLNEYAGGKIIPEFNRGNISESMGRVFDFTVRNSVEYNKKINKHFVQLYAANEVSGKTNYRFNSMIPNYLYEYRMGGYPSWVDINPEGYSSLDLSRLGGTYFEQDRAVSFIGSGVYSYDNRYVFNGNWRSDGVDILGTENQFTPLWSAGIKWNAHNENFMESFSHILSRLVISGGYGFRGSINRMVYPFDIYSLSGRIYDELPIASGYNWGNPVLKWEKKEETNFGLELSLFKGRINFEANYYDELVTDLLGERKLAVSLGRSAATINSSSLSNKGIEISARIEVIKNNNLLWEVGGNFTKVENKLLDVYNDLIPKFDNVSSSFMAYNSPQMIEGYPSNSWFGYKFSHVNPDNGHPIVWAQKETVTTTSSGATRSLEDELIDLFTMPESELVTNYRTYYLGHQRPDVYGGFNTRLTYKRFELAGYFTFASGNKLPGFIDRMAGPAGRYGGDINASRTNRTTDNINMWRRPGDITDIPVFVSNESNYTKFLVDKDLENGGYMKCSFLSFGWRAPQSLLKNTFIKQLRATLIGSNLFTVTSYSGTDPETFTTFGYPTTPSYTLSVSLGF